MQILDQNWGFLMIKMAQKSYLFQAQKDPQKKKVKKVYLLKIAKNKTKDEK